MVGLVKYILILSSVLTFSQEHILIGDSQTYYLARHSTKIKRVSQLSQSGIGVSQLTAKVRLYPVSPQVKSVSLCIGVNDGYKDKGVKKLMERLQNTFPNAKIFIIQGSWGWGNVKNINQTNLDSYYKQFPDTIIYPAIGEGDPHRDKKVYRIIMKNIENCLAPNK
jgi:hypothetical protein